MEKIVQKFSSFAEAERADREFYASLTPEQRVLMLQELNAMFWVNWDSAPPHSEWPIQITRRGEPE